MTEALEIDLGGLPVGGAFARRAYIRPGAVLARVVLDRDGKIFSRRVDLGQKTFIDHEQAPSGPGSIRDSFPDAQCDALCAKIIQAINSGGPLAEAYHQPPAPATIALHPVCPA